MAFVLSASVATAGTLPAGFQEKAVLSGLTQPTSVAFSPDGRVFVAEKSGVIKVFDSLSDPTPTVFADLSSEVYNYWDRGLLGMVLDPEFPVRPYVYVLYTRDALPGGATPTWGGTSLADGCPSPPGPTTDGCVATGRLSKLTVGEDDTMTSETPLITDWCQQFPSHSIGDLAFGPEGDLFVSGGEGANFNSADWGQSGNPLNPCGDPPGGVGEAMTPPLAEGGALRAQDVRTEADPTGLDGAILRVDPDTGEGLPGNPLSANADANARRIVAYGLRNPFRIAVRPGTDQVWVGDVGWGTWEEIDRVLEPHGATAVNFGWPCYEGGESGVSSRTGAYEGAGLDLCKSLYNPTDSAVAPPYFSYNHEAHVVPGEACTTGSSSTSGLAFYTGSLFPAKYDGALFFADYSRNCIWAMLPGPNGVPDPAKVEPFDEGAAAPVNLEEGPDGALYFPDLTGGKVWRIGYTPGNSPPHAVATATPQNGIAPLEVQFSAAQSTDPGDTLSYAWDLDGDGQFDDSTSVSPKYTYTESGVHVAKVEVTDSNGASEIASVSIQVGNTPPTATILSPESSLSWAVGDGISFSGAAIDPQDGALPASAYTWKVILHHCPSNCHEHLIETFEGEKTGMIVAPDHEFPSWLEIELTVVDSGGLTDTKSVEIHPQTVSLGLEPSPAGPELIANDQAITAASSALTVIKGSNNTVIAPTPQTIAGVKYAFQSWSDGGAAAHDVKINQSETLKAVYARSPEKPTIAATYPGSPANSKRPRVKGSLGPGMPSEVEVFTNPGCSGTPAATGSPAEFATGGISIKVSLNVATPLSAMAKNAVGPSPCSNSISYIEDSTPPETMAFRVLAAKKSAAGVKGRLARRAKQRQVKFGLEANEAVSRFECSLDGAAFSPCTTPVTYLKRKPGRHRFQTRAVDLAGNVDPSPATRAFRVVKPKGTKGHKKSSERPLILGAALDRLGALIELGVGQLR